MSVLVKDLGDIVRASVVFKVGGNPTDPTDVILTVRKPDGTTTDYQYNPGDIQRDGVGEFHYDIVTDQDGEWAYKFVGTGTAADVGQAIFFIRPDLTADNRMYVSLDRLKATMKTATSERDGQTVSIIKTASRAIDKAAGRFFYKLGTHAAPATRYFTADRYDPSLNLGDVIELTSVTLDTDGNGSYDTTWVEGTDFLLEPYNVSELGEPQTRLVLLPQAARFWPYYQKSVKVTGVFGFEQVPSAITDYTEIVAARLLDRATEAPYGFVLSGNDLGSITRIAKQDPDFDLLVGPYVKKALLV